MRRYYRAARIWLHVNWPLAVWVGAVALVLEAVG